MKTSEIIDEIVKSIGENDFDKIEKLFDKIILGTGMGEELLIFYKEVVRKRAVLI